MPVPEPRGSGHDDVRVTVLMPVRAHRPDYIREALRSVARQTSPRWRLLVIDDGGGAGLRDLLAGALPDRRADLVPNAGRGFAAALNTGLRGAGTDFVSILFADDVWAEDAIEVFTDHIERFGEVDCFHAARSFIDDEGRAISSVHPPRESFTPDDFRHGSPVKHPFCVRRARALAIGGMDESLEPIGIDDYDFPWTMAEAGLRFMAVTDCLYRVRDHRSGFRLTTHVPRNVQVRALRRIMVKHGVDRRHVDRVLAERRRGHLRQALYRSSLDRWLKQRLGHDPRRGWREPYA